MDVSYIDLQPIEGLQILNEFLGGVTEAEEPVFIYFIEHYDPVVLLLVGEILWKNKHPEVMSQPV